MGSLLSTPSVPAPQPVVEEEDDAAQEAEERIENLRRRRRGRAGTVKNSYRGILSETVEPDQNAENLGG